MFVSFGSTAYFHLGDTAPKLAKEEPDLSSLMASVISPPSAPILPTRERHRAAAILPTSYMQLSKKKMNSGSHKFLGT